MKKIKERNQTFCQIGTTGKGMPCLANINTLAGLTEPCEVCAPYLQNMRDQMGWVPFRGRFHMSNKLADFQHDALLDRINAASSRCEIREGIGLCDQCSLPKWPQKDVGYGHMVCLDCLAEEKGIEALIGMALHPNSEEIQEKVLKKLRDNE